jgi:hypothetical protein
MSQTSSVHLHHAPSLRHMTAVFAHLKDSHVGEHDLTCAKTCTTFDSSILTKFSLSGYYSHIKYAFAKVNINLFPSNYEFQLWPSLCCGLDRLLLYTSRQTIKITISTIANTVTNWPRSTSIPAKTIYLSSLIPIVVEL